jgi:hypothetical protein
MVRRFFDLTYNQLRFEEALASFEQFGTWEDFSMGQKHYGKESISRMLVELGSGFPSLKLKSGHYRCSSTSAACRT